MQNKKDALDISIDFIQKLTECPFYDAEHFKDLPCMPDRICKDGQDKRKCWRLYFQKKANLKSDQEVIKEIYADDLKEIYDIIDTELVFAESIELDSSKYSAIDALTIVRNKIDELLNEKNTERN